MNLFVEWDFVDSGYGIGDRETDIFWMFYLLGILFCFML